MSFLESALKKGRVAGVVVLIAGSVAACTHTGTPLDQFGDKTKIGSVIGATGGGLLAAAAGGGASGIAAGVLLGGLTGGVLGNKLDNEDQRLMQRASHRALETGRTGTSTAWRNPDSGHRGRIKPTRTYQRANGGFCREYQQTIIVGGEERQGFGTACRQPDGSWQTV
ncbi:MAG: RT0821/Lpp0805 family surface protein [Geminicoccaceae bacterium]